MNEGPILPAVSRAHRRSKYSGAAVVGFFCVAVLTGCHGQAPQSDQSQRTGQAKQSAQSQRTASSPCAYKPSATNTGPTGQLKASSVTVLDTKSATLQNVRVQNLMISAADVTVRNVEVAGAIFVKGDGATIDHVQTTGIAVSSASGTTIEHTDIANGGDDGVHLTSDSGRQVRDITMRYNYIHSPRVDASAHYDGTQVRGVSGLTITCSLYDAGPYRPPYNAAIYIEDANGGNTNVLIEHNWLDGFGFSVMIGSPGTRVIGNRVGGEIHWNTCYLGAGVRSQQIVDYANVQVANGQKGPLCAHADQESSGG